MNDTRCCVYVVDDDVSVCESVANLIRAAGWKAETFTSAQDFLGRSRSKPPGCVVLDVRLPGLSGLDLQQELIKTNVNVPVIFLTGHGDIPTSVRAIKSGALEFFTKPVDKDAFLAAIRQAVASQPAQGSEGKVARRLSDQMVGRSARLRAVLNLVTIVAPTDSSVLILGETGTGKELVARAVHARSDRSSKPLVSVNCSAIQPSLMASELFGHEKGSFTGAFHQRLGRFEVADGGTIFLDEIGDLSPEAQLALLRVLQEREFERVGGNHAIPVDVRVIAATNRDLKAAIAAGTFRSDLFYRLDVFPIHVPPLRERTDDIPLLVEHFLRTHASKPGQQLRSMDEKTFAMLKAYSWPGNIRELQNVIERWAIVSESAEVSIDESWLSGGEARPLAADAALSPDGTFNLRDRIEAMERTLIGQALAAVGGNQSEAARRLGLSRGSLLERLRKYGKAGKRRLEAASSPG